MDADPKLSARSDGGPQASGKTDVASAVVGEGIVTSVHRPAPGAISVVEVPPGAQLKLDFASGDAKFAILDVDLVLAFPDGAKVILPGYAFNLVGADASDASFSDKAVTPQQLLSLVDDLHLLADNSPQILGSSAKAQQDGDNGKEQGETREAAPSEAPPAPPPQPAAPTSKFTGVADFDKPPEPVLDRSVKKPADDAIPASSGSPPSHNTSNGAPSSSSGDQVADGGGNGNGNVSAAHLDVVLLGVSGDQVTTLPSGGVQILGAASNLAASIDPAFAVQQQARTLTGTAFNDIIYAANPNRMPSGTTERLLDVHVTFPDEGVVAKTATITNLPAGYVINNGTLVGSNWVVQLDPTDPSHLQIELVYTLPADGAHPDANGFLGSFNLNILFGTTDATGATRLYSGSQTFVIRDIQSESDVTITSADGQSQILGLNAVPPGAIISAGDGDDIVYAGPGRDVLDGGTGNNTLSYKYSAAGVTVDLGAGTASGGYATGDSIQNFSNLEGSSHADRLIGTVGSNIFYGSGGGDTIIGNGGVDTVDYSASTAGVSVNLTTGVGTGGLANGDTLIGITNLMGSATGNNTLIGNSDANVITGGAGNDVLDGAGGADILIAGAGNDTAVYRGGEVSIDGGSGANTLQLAAVVAVNLGSADQTAGDAVNVTNFQNVDASALATAVSIIGSAGVNTIRGGAGADSIDGAGGADAIYGGAGDDQIIYRGTEASIDGGADTNTLVMLAQANVTLGNADQTSGDVTVVSSFQNIDASQLTSAQAVTITGSSGVNILTGGAGSDTIDGAGGADTISGGAGDDAIAYHGTENAIDGGTGANTLVLQAATTVDLGNADQTIGDGAWVQNFINVNAAALSAGVAVTGSAAANVITGGSGDDSIDGGGGADVIAAGAGNDTVTYRGSESSVDGGAGSDTLVVATGVGVTAVNFAVAASADQTTGDVVSVTRFENLDASALTTALNVTGSIAANAIVTGSGNDTVDGGGGADTIATGSGDDSVAYHGTEVSIDGGTGTNTLALLDITDINLTRVDQSIGDSVNVGNFQNVDASALGAGQGVSIIGSAAANIITGGAGADTINGGGGADVIDAGSGNDTVSYWGTEVSIAGGAGSNTLVLRAAAVVNLANAADQTAGDAVAVSDFQNVDASQLSTGSTITGSSAANIITGGTGADTVDGGGGADTIAAGAGNDIVYVHGDEIAIDGGDGNDTLVLPAASTVTSVNFAVAGGLDQTAGDIATVANFESLDASGMTTALTVTGSVLANTLISGAGNDVIHGGGGGDIIAAGAGNDAIDYWGTEVSIDGGAGSNTLVLRAAAAIDLTASDQTSGDSTTVTNITNVDASAVSTGVSVVGNAAANTVTGGAGADNIDGGGGADVINAAGGNDTVAVHGTEASVDGGAGSDTLVLSAGTTVTNVNFAVVAGSDQTAGDTVAVRNFENLDAGAVTTALTVTGSSSANTITAGYGNDTIDGGGGADVIDAGAGDDTVTYRGTEASVDGGSGVNTLTLQALIDVNLSRVDQTIGDAATVMHFQNVDASALGSAQGVSIVGSSAANLLTGGAGNDAIDGGGGADAINAGAGNDIVAYRGTEASLDGGTGSNTLQLQAVATVDLGAADQTSGDGVSVVNFDNVDASALGPAQGVTIRGSTASNTITGGAGDDVIDGAAGTDVINAGAGNDSVHFYGTELVIDGGLGSNTLVLDNPGGITRVDLSVAPGSDQTTGDTVNVSNFQNINASILSAGIAVTGSSSANVITTGSGNDTVDGGGGSDTIFTGAGDDTVSYYNSEVSLDGGTGTNTLVLRAAATVDLANADQTAGDATTVSNFQNADASQLATGTMITGSIAANVITGGAGNDTIDGGGGADTINAGGGDDSVTVRGSELSVDGGTGSDTLVLAGSSTVTAVNFALAAGADQTAGDSVVVAGFENLDARAMTTALSVNGSSGANAIATGSADDVIHGGGGADIISAGTGNDTVDYWGTEVSIDGGGGANTLVVRASATINLAASDQSAGDLATVTNFQNVDASGLTATQVTDITGSSGVNVITGGAGDDTIDGGGGADVINAGAGNDTVTFYGTEASVDGGAGSDTLVLRAGSTVTSTNFAVAAGADQTGGDAVSVANFENLDGSALTTALNVTGASGANAITTGSGNDTVDGGGGADVIATGAGDDTVSYRGTELSIDGGTGTNTLVLQAATDINLGRVDQTVGDSATISNFQNVNAGALGATQGVSITGSAAANVITGGLGADVIDGAGGADVIAAGDGDDAIAYRGSEVSIDGGSGSNTLQLKTTVTVNLAAGDQTLGDGVTVSNIGNVDASALGATQGVSITGSAAANTIIGGAGADTVDGGGGNDAIAAGAGNDTVRYYGTETAVDGGSGTDTLVLLASGGTTAVNLAVPANVDQTAGDSVEVTNFENVDASALATAIQVTGSSSANVITTGAGNDSIDGGGGADTVAAGDGNDAVAYYGTEAAIDGSTGANTLVLRNIATVNLGNGDQTSGDTTAVSNFQNVDASALATGATITGSAAANVITGGAGNDTIDGGGGADVINAAGGDDAVIYRGSETSIDGASGADTLILSAGASVSAVNFAAAAGTDQTAGDTVSVVNFENLAAAAMTTALTVTGTSGANTIATGSGDDIIHGGGGADVIDAGAGNDAVDYWGAETSIDGGIGSNTLVVRANATINLSATDQSSGDFTAVANFQNVDASNLTAGQAVTVQGSSGVNTITGGAGADTIDGGGGADVIDAGAGNDIVTVRGGEASVDGGAGADLLVLAAGSGVTSVDFSIAAGADQTAGDTVAVANFESLDASAMATALTVTGSSAANAITTGAGSDIIDGAGGADIVNAGAGNDTVSYRGTEVSIDAGSGTDTLVLRASGGIATVDLSGAAGSDQTYGDSVAVSNFENVDASVLLASQGITILGSAAANVITGGAGADIIDGGNGADTIVAGGGNDTVSYYGAEVAIDAGSGTDTLVLAATGGVTAVDFSVAANADQTTGDAVNVANFENLNAAVAATALTVTGSSAANIITTGAGNDMIDGGGGADVLSAGAGNDTVAYYNSEVSIDGGTGVNTLALRAVTTVNLGNIDQTIGDAVAVSNFQNVDGSALSSGVQITGAIGANVITGGAGNDTIDGAGGADVIGAGAGNDLVTFRGTETSVDGGAGIDTLTVAAGAALTAVNFAVAAGADQTAGDASLVANFENLDATAVTTALTVTGSSAANIIATGAGNDSIDGGGGADAISAGSGNDTVAYYSSESAIDGGTGSNTIVLRAVTTVNLGNVDQTTGDVTSVSNFQNVDASALSASVTITGSTAANVITAGLGNDIIDGLGGADTIAAGAGDDTVAYYGTEASLDGGGGTNTLLMRAAATVSLASPDQTSGDATSVANFQNVDASALNVAVRVTGSIAANTITGGTGDDVIDGGGGADVIAAGAGNDTVTFRGGETSIDGGSGTDTLVLAATGGVTAVNFAVATNVDQTTGDSVNVTNFENLDASALSSNLTVTAAGFANVITTGAGNDSIDGGGGADAINAGGGSDTVAYYGSETSIDGGGGVNTLQLRTATTVNLAAGDQTGSDTTSVANFQNVDASALSSAVTITGSAGTNVITGGAGNDTIDGFGGADVIAAGNGDDLVTYRGTEVSIDGGAGTDTLVVAAGSTITAVNFSVATGADQTAGDTVSVTNFETLDAGALGTALTVTGSASANTITTGSGNDIIDGAGGADVIAAGGGNDTVSYYGTETSIDGGTGVNTLLMRAAAAVNLGNIDQTTGDVTSVAGFQNVDASLLSSAVSITGSSIANVITGGSGNDSIDGAGGADAVSAGAGNDTVVYHGTETTVDGGAGSDTLTLASAGGITAVNFAVAAGADQTAGDTAIVTNFENLDASVLTTALAVTGATGANAITTGAGNDTIDGGGGADTIAAGSGDDVVSYYNSEVSIDGGGGLNTLILKAAATVNLGSIDQTSSDAVTVSNFQNVDASALSAAVIITGSAAANAITGGAGNDTIDGAGGADTINAGAGNDIVTYQGSEVAVDGGSGSDTLVLAASGGISAVNFAAAAGVDQTSGDGVNVTGFENINASIVATALNVTGSSSANVITTGAGNDIIDGGGGVDTIAAGDGDDTVSYYGTETSVDGGTGTNTLVMRGGATNINLANSDQTTGDATNVSGFQNVDASALAVATTIRGTTGVNIITGGSGNDSIDGAGGADVIDAGGGNDSVSYYGTEVSMTGGTGDNTLVLRAAATVNLANIDQTTADSTNVGSFQNVDASALAVAVSLTGSAAANTITGGSGNDTIEGNGGADTINAGAGDDTVAYHGSEVAIDGGTGTDTLIVAAGATLTAVNLAVASGSDQTTGDSVSVTNFENLDAGALTTAVVVTGSAFANTLITGAGNDTIDGGGGTDVVVAGGGNDTVFYYGSETSLDGGTGTNTLLLKAAATVNLANSDQTSGDTVAVSNVQNVDASALAAGVSITGASGANVITGGFGNDTIDGAGGTDTINAGSGDDTVRYYGTETAIDGGTGSDTLILAATGGITAVNFTVAAGADQTTGDSVAVANFENLDASVATSALTVAGSSGINTITTGSGNDSIDGGGGSDTINAGAGNDIVSYRGTEFSIDGGTGTNTLLLRAVAAVNLANTSDQTLGDTVTTTNFQNVDASQLVTGVSITGTTGVNVITGGTGNDIIDGAGGADTIAAAAGNDTVTYYGSEATIDGGAGSDTLTLAAAGGITAVNLAAAPGTDQTVGDAVGVTNFENLDGSTIGTALTVTGSSAANTILTGSGNDTIDGGGGADVIAAGAGDDTVTYQGSETSIDGGTGVNTLKMNVATTINLGNIDQTTGDVTAVTSFQNVDASALSAGISITGSSGANIIVGGGGGDTIDGAGGTDTITAGGGDDIVSYRGGEISIDGEGGVNTLLLRSAVTVNLANADQTSADTVTVANFQNVDASQLATGVTITGSAGVNAIAGSSGNDIIDGGGGTDTVAAGAGNDSVTYRGSETTIDGGSGSDTLVLANAGGITSVNFAVAAGADQTAGDSVSVANFENLDGSILTTALTVTGSAAANAITTGSGNDTIDGGGGADAISAGAGNDTVLYYGGETSIDGGGGTNSLILRAAATVNLGNAADQTSGDTTTVANFQNVDASSLAIGVSLTGSAVANTLTGGAGGDTIDGGGGADIIASGGGDDTVTSHGTEVTVDGGTGIDTLVMVATGGATAVDLSVVAGADQTLGDTSNIRNFENVDASALATAIAVTGSTSANTITTGAGNDTIDGNGGGDVINGGAGDDTIAYWGSETSISGGSGTNTLLLRVSGTINLGSADQTSGDVATVNGFQNVDASSLSSGASITGSSGVNVLTGGSGGDYIDGAGGADVINAGGGNDTVNYRGTEASVDGGSGADMLTLAAMGGITAVNLSVGANADQTVGDALNVVNFESLNASIATTALTVTGSTGGNYLTTGSGDDVIDGLGGGDNISAGTGNDTVSYYGTEASIDGGTGTNTLILNAATTVALANADQTTGDLTTVSNFQNVNGAAVTAGMTITGSSGINVITGGSGDDIIDGGAGADNIDGSAGNDTIYYRSTAAAISGGTGNNSLILLNNVTVNLANTDQTTGDSVNVTNFQNVTAQNVTGPVSLTGSSAANSIIGSNGDDTIDGNGGADTINAGNGNDTVSYRGTETSIDGGAGADMLTMLAAGGTTRVDLSVTAGADQTTGDSVNVTNFESVNAAIFATAITIVGSSAANTITSGSGDDIIQGNAGADTITAGAGNDTVDYWGTEVSIDGGTGNNTLIVRSVSGLSSVNLAAAAGVDLTGGDSVSVKNFQNLDSSQVGNGLTVTGSSAANIITTGGGVDAIDGGGGADTISAGAGNDTVTYRGAEVSIDGGAGTDTLVLAAGGGITAVNFSVTAGTDQTTGDAVAVSNFEYLSAGSLTTALTVTGSTGRNDITTGSGNDIIDGNGGADNIAAGTGNDTVTYRGGEATIDGGAGNNTLVMQAAATVNLANSDQTTGDLVTVTNFQNVDASALAGAVSITGSTGVNIVTGGAGNDTIDGGGGADTLSGGQGDDTIAYYGGEVTIDGGGGTNILQMRAATTVNLATTADQTTGDGVTVTNFLGVDASLVSAAVTITGTTGANTIIGGAGNDTIDGNGGADTINAGSGNDSVTYRGSETSIDGGAGSDLLTLNAAGSITAINFAAAAGADQTTGDSVNVANFESVNATVYTTALTVTGSSLANTISTGSGNDIIDGQGGADVINAGAGNDTVSYYGTETSVDGGTGTNTLVMNTSAVLNLANVNQLSFGAGTIANFQNVNASAVSAAVSITGSSGANIITGGSGNDTVDGSGGTDTIDAGAGNDTVSYYGTETSINGGTGTNTLVLRAAATVNLGASDQTTSDTPTVTNFQNVDGSAVSSGMTMTGSSAANTITGGSGDDTVDGAGGADAINAGAGNDTVTARGSEASIDGGTGTDTLILTAGSAVTAVNFTVASGLDQTTGDSTAIANFENLNAAALTTAVSVVGLSLANTITTGSGNDTVDGGGGADVIAAGAGDDSVSWYGSESAIDGGGGINTLVMKAAGTVNLGNADQTSSDSANVTNFQNVNASALSSAASITGSSQANTIIGGAGNDTIDGAGGGDTINAGSGDDTVTYRGAEASIDGGAGADTLVLAATAGITAVNLAAAAGSDQTTGDAVNITNFESVNAGVATSALTVTGSSSANTITTGSGNDSIDGGGGADIISAGSGDDTVTYRGTEASIDGGTGTNTLVMTAAAVVNLGNGDQTTGDATAVSNFQNVNASAVSANVAITGTAAVNVITGGSGNDVIDGAGGADTINAGAGNDTVSYYGSEGAIDGGTGANTLLMKAAATVNLGATADQTTSDSTTLTNFVNVDASALSSAVTLTGSSAINTITSGAGNDTIDGAGGADTINAGDGNDTVTYRGTEAVIDGGAGSDTMILAAAGGTTAMNLAVAAGNDQTTGDSTSVRNFENIDASTLASALTVTGTSGANSIATGSGNDTIDGGGGADAISAGSGNDTVSYYGSETSIDGGGGVNTLLLKAAGTVNLAATTDQTSSDSATVTNFVNVDASTLSSGATLTGSSAANVITGGSGNDSIDGAGGADTINAGSGNDTVTYRGGEASIDGGAGSDTLVLAGGSVTAVNLAAAAGTDQTSGDGLAVINFENVDASALSGALTVTGTSAANAIATGSGNDSIDGGGGADAINAGGGNDSVAWYGSEVSIDGGSGSNTLLMKAAGIINLGATSDQTSGDSAVVTNFVNIDASALSSAATLTGSSAINSIIGGSGNDSIDGAGGADTINAGAGADTVTYRGGEVSIDGGSGNDTLVLAAAGGTTTVNFSVAAGLDQTVGDGVSVVNFEHLDASALSSALTITGSTSANVITAGAGNDIINGGGGADTIAAGTGNDSVSYYGSEISIDGGGGTNTLVMTSAVTVNLGNGADQTSGDTTTVTNFHNVDASGLSSGVSITGTGTANTITGGSGNDSIDGGGGADSINAGSGNDTVVYHGTETSIDGGGGTNTLVMGSAATVNLGNGADQTSGDGTTVANFHHVDASGLSTGVSITGTSAANTITGGSGADTIDGGGGLDSINAGGGDDTVTYHGTESAINGAGGSNTLVLASAASVNLANGDQTGGDATAVSNFSNVDGSALSSALTLTGSTGNNTITGGSGNDSINGGGGLDHLFGGGGDDLFIIDHASLALGSTIDGGSGSNALNIAANSGTVSDAELLAALTNIHSIDFTASNVNASLSLSGSQISQMDGGASNTLTLKMDAGDTFNLTDAAANYTTSVSGNTTTYTIYDDAAHTNLVAHVALVA